MRSLLTILVLTLAGCTDWQPVAFPSPSDTAWSATGTLRVTTVSERKLRGTSILLSGDSLLVRADTLTPGSRVALSVVARIERHGFSGTKTAVLAGVLVATTLILGAGLDDTWYKSGAAY